MGTPCAEPDVEPEIVEDVTLADHDLEDALLVDPRPEWQQVNEKVLPFRRLLEQMQQDLIGVRKPRIYLAARYGRRLEVCDYAEQLTRRQYEVTSSWLAGPLQLGPGGCPIGESGEQLCNNLHTLAGLSYRQHISEQCLADLRRSDIAIVFTEKGDQATTGGRHVEFGVAIERCLPVYRLGPAENIFYDLKQVSQFYSFGAIVESLESYFG